MMTMTTMVNGIQIERTRVGELQRESSKRLIVQHHAGNLVQVSQLDYGEHARWHEVVVRALVVARSEGTPQQARALDRTADARLKLGVSVLAHETLELVAALTNVAVIVDPRSIARERARRIDL